MMDKLAIPKQPDLNSKVFMHEIFRSILNPFPTQTPTPTLYFKDHYLIREDLLRFGSCCCGVPELPGLWKLAMKVEIEIETYNPNERLDRQKMSTVRLGWL